MGQTKEQKVIKQLTNPSSNQKFTAIATEMFLPNYSGLKKGLKVNDSGAISLDDIEFTNNADRTITVKDFPSTPYNPVNGITLTITGSRGQENGSGSGGDGGDLNINAGRGGTGNESGNDGVGGNIYIDAGASGYEAGNIYLGRNTAGNTIIKNFTQLGGTTAPKIKQKTITFTTGANQGDVVSVAMGLSYDKILGYLTLVEPFATAKIPENVLWAAGYAYNTYIIDDDFYIVNITGNSANILSKSGKVLLTYTE
jgi:hypothetical protein